MRRFLAIVMPLILAAFPVSAGFRDGVIAYQREDYRTAMRELQPFLNRNDIPAQTNVPALYYIGMMKLRGLGTTKNRTFGTIYLKMAGLGGHAGAQFALGKMYYFSIDAPRYYSEAAKWFERAARQGVVGAQANLGEMYFQGRGVPTNDVLAYMWTSIAAAGGSEIAAKYLNTIKRRMSPAQAAKAHKMVAEWKPTKEKYRKYKKFRMWLSKPQK